MSFEGYSQCWCEDGHCFVSEAGMFADDSSFRCPHCKKPAVVVHTVDDTNCDSCGLILAQDIKTFLIKEAVIEECPTCHAKKVTSPEVYRIPTEEEITKLEVYRRSDEHGDEYHRICDNSLVSKEDGNA